MTFWAKWVFLCHISVILTIQNSSGKIGMRHHNDVRSNVRECEHIEAVLGSISIDVIGEHIKKSLVTGTSSHLSGTVCGC